MWIFLVLVPPKHIGSALHGVPGETGCLQGSPRAIKFGGDATGVPNEAIPGGLAVGLAEMEVKFSIISGLVGL